MNNVLRFLKSVNKKLTTSASVYCLAMGLIILFHVAPSCAVATVLELLVGLVSGFLQLKKTAEVRVFTKRQK